MTDDKHKDPRENLDYWSKIQTTLTQFVTQEKELSHK